METYWRIVFGKICRSVNEDVGMFPRNADHLLRPGKADMTANDLQGGEFQSDFINVLFEVRVML